MDNNKKVKSDGKIGKNFYNIFSGNNGKYSCFEYVFAAFISSFLLANIFQMLSNSKFTDLSNYYASISKTAFFLILAVAFAVQILIWRYTKIKTIIPYFLFISTLLLSILYAINYNTKELYFLIGIAFVDFIIAAWLIKDDKLQISKIELSYRTVFSLICVLFLISVIFISYCTVLKYKSYMNSTFDFGIFCQMFQNMKTTGLPDTTVERNQFMSHFGVHFSPFFYLLLPGYLIFSTPEYLLCAQAFCVGLGVFAVYLICKQMGYSPKAVLAFSVIYLSFPSLFNGCFRDFHENKFLTVIIMFLMYFVISKNLYGTIGFSLLTLSVKEDAAIYVMVIAVYMVLATKEKIRGGIVFIIAVLYFIIAQGVINSNGEEGIMMWRLSNYFVDGEQSFLSVFKGIFFDIGNLIKNMFTAEKVAFIIWMLLPVAFTPLANKKLSTLVLLAPMIPINLMQEWKYQYDIDFQYSYGVAALIIFASIITVIHLSKDTQRLVLLFGIMISVVMFSNLAIVKAKTSVTTYKQVHQSASNSDEILKEIPLDASVTANEALVPHLYKIKDLYSFPARYGSISQTQYYVIDIRYKNSNEYDVSSIMKNDYTLIKSSGFVQIYKHKSL